MKVGIYARLSTQERQTLPLQIKDLREYARRFFKWREVNFPTKFTNRFNNNNKNNLCLFISFFIKG